jgi:hypothetical protein
MIFWALLAMGIAYTMMIYAKNRADDRARHRRQRYEEMQDRLMRTLQHKNDDEDDEHNEEQ